MVPSCSFFFHAAQCKILHQGTLVQSSSSFGDDAHAAVRMVGRGCPFSSIVRKNNGESREREKARKTFKKRFKKRRQVPSWDTYFSFFFYKTYIFKYTEKNKCQIKTYVLKLTRSLFRIYATIYNFLGRI